jgi:acid phosphatase type 7
MIVDHDPEKDLLLRFAVSGVGAGEVRTATLRLYCVGGAVVTGGEFHGSADNGWAESNVTWDTAPAAHPISVGALGPVAAGNWYEVDLTPLVTGDGVYSLRATSTSGDGADYSSKEGAFGFAPQLLVTAIEP